MRELERLYSAAQADAARRCHGTVTLAHVVLAMEDYPILGEMLRTVGLRADVARANALSALPTATMDSPSEQPAASSRVKRLFELAESEAAGAGRPPSVVHLLKAMTLMSDGASLLGLSAIAEAAQAFLEASANEGR